MSIAKTTRPHLLTRETAAARIEALEAMLEKMAADSDVELTQLTHAVADNIRKIEALEADNKRLQSCIETREDALRTIANPWQNQLARIEALEAALNKLACWHVTQDPLWWQSEARAALAPEPDK